MSMRYVSINLDFLNFSEQYFMIFIALVFGLGLNGIVNGIYFKLNFISIFLIDSYIKIMGFVY